MDIQKQKFPFEAQKTPGYKPISDVPKNIAQKIISAMMAIPYIYAQACVSGLEKYTQQQIREMYELIIHCPPEYSGEPDLIAFPFTPIEDIILLCYINKTPKLSLDDFIVEYGQFFKPIRTKSAIKRRISQLENLLPEEINDICNNFAENMAKQERLYDSIFPDSSQIKQAPIIHPNEEQCYCLENDILESVVNIQKPNIDIEIENIKKSALGLISKRFEINDLAIFINEHVKYSMKHKIVIIGRQSNNEYMDNDIDLTFFNSMVCNHVSRAQATIRFMVDGNFYCQNIGEVPFRINGHAIMPQTIALVPNDSIFDFDNTIFLFFINYARTQHILNDLSYHKLEEEEEEEYFERDVKNEGDDEEEEYN